LRSDMDAYKKLKAVHLREQIEELKGKLSLKRRDNATIFQHQLENIKRNEENILSLRCRVKEARQELAKWMNKDTEVIGNALTGHREKQLECKRCDAQTAHITLDEDVQVLKKRLNHFVHQKACRNRRLDDLKLQLRDFNLLEYANFEVADQKRVRMLSTKLDKMTLKRNTASFINRTYKKTLSKLNKDYLYMPNTIDEFESDVKATAAEFDDLQKIYQVAQKGQEMSRAMRIAVEREFYTGKQDRDKILLDVRREAKANSEMPDIEVKRTYNDVINRKSEQQGKKADVPSDLLARMEPILKLFSSITNTASAEEIPIAYRRQIDNFQQLTELSKAYLNKLEDKKKKHAQLKKDLANAKFKQTNQIVQAEDRLLGLVSSVENIELDRVRKTQENHGVMSQIDLVKQGVATLAEKFNATLTEDEHLAVLPTDVSQQIKLIVTQIDKVKKKVNAEPSIGECSLDSEEDPLEQLIKMRANRRITIGSQEDDHQTDAFLIDDTIMNENYRTYDEVKCGTQKSNRRKR